MLTMEVFAAWKAMHIEIIARLSLKQPPIRTPNWWAVISEKMFCFKQRPYITMIDPTTTTPWTAWCIMSSVGWISCRRRLITPTPANSHAWQRHKDTPSQRALLVDKVDLPSKSSVASTYWIPADWVLLAIAIMMTQAKERVMAISSTGLTRSRLMR